MLNKYFKIILFIAFVLITGNKIFAQGPPPPPPPVPIDGGIIGLFLVAVGYAVKKIRDNSKN